MVEVREEEIRWAYNLWNSMTMGGSWVLPGLGIYRRTGERELTLIELHQSTPEPSDTLFDNHEYITLLATEMGWEMKEAIERAFDKDAQPLNIPEDQIGRVAACSSDCGSVIRIEPFVPGTICVGISDGLCPVCGEIGFDPSWNGIHVVVDDRGYILKVSEEDELTCLDCGSTNLDDVGESAGGLICLDCLVKEEE